MHVMFSSVGNHCTLQAQGSLECLIPLRRAGYLSHTLLLVRIRNRLSSRLEEQSDYANNST